MSQIDQVLSLGWNCEPTLALRRLGFAGPLSIFDNATISRRPLLRLLRSDFRELLEGEVDVRCHKTWLRLYHHQAEVLADPFFALVRRRIERFRAARSDRILFVRLEPEPERLAGFHAALRAALLDFGFRDFELSIVYRRQGPPPAGCFHFHRPLDDASRPWLGCRQDWDAWLRHIRTQVELPKWKA